MISRPEYTRTKNTLRNNAEYNNLVMVSRLKVERYMGKANIYFLWEGEEVARQKYNQNR